MTTGEPADARPEDLARERAIRDLLERAAGPSKFLPFDRFLEIALYAPGLGYYTRAPVDVGPTGDFYTAASVTPVFAWTLAERVRAEFARLGRPARFTLVELGPGTGSLAAELLGSLAEGREGPELPLEYVGVDVSHPLAEKAAARIHRQHPALPFPVRFVSSVAEVGLFQGAVVGNEFLDALPFRRLLWTHGEWRELGVRVGGDGLEWGDAPFVTPLPAPSLPVDLEEGSIVEVSPRAEAAVRELSDQMVRGAAIFLDYGEEESSLVRGHLHGTLAAARGHAAPDPLDRPGSADLSAFVNFTRLAVAARVAGFEVKPLTGQARALHAWGWTPLADRWVASASDSVERVRRQLALKNLLFGFETFRALELTLG